MQFNTLEEAVINSRFREKIDYVLNNENICGMGIIKRGASYTEYSNCHGTTLFTLNAINDFLKDFPFKTSRLNGAIVLGDYNSTSASFIPTNMNRPGHLSHKHAYYFLMNKCKKIGKLEKDSIIAHLENEKEGDIFEENELVHTSIYLGKVNNEDLIFHQNGLGGEFQI